MLTLQEISDRIEIQELLVRYSHAVDTRDWEMYENVFTPDAFIDYTCFGGPAGDPKEIRAFLEMAMPNFSSFQHMIANTVLDFVDADHVKGRTICHNPMVMDLGGDKTHVFYCGDVRLEDDRATLLGALLALCDLLDGVGDDSPADLKLRWRRRGLRAFDADATAKAEAKQAGTRKEAEERIVSG